MNTNLIAQIGFAMHAQAGATAEVQRLMDKAAKDGVNVLDDAVTIITAAGFLTMTDAQWVAADLDNDTLGAWYVLAPLGARNKTNTAIVKAIVKAGKMPKTVGAYRELYAAAEKVRNTAAKAGGGMTGVRKMLAESANVGEAKAAALTVAEPEKAAAKADPTAKELKAAAAWLKALADLPESVRAERVASVVAAANSI